MTRQQFDSWRSAHPEQHIATNYQRCTSCEDLQMSSDAAARAKDSCLWQFWNTSGFPSAGKPPVAKNIKALFESKGRLFTAQQQNNSLGLYTDPVYSAYKHSCSGWPAPSIAPSCYAGPPAELAALNGSMDLCYRLSSMPRGTPAVDESSPPGTGVSAATFAQNADLCSSAIERINRIDPDSACQASTYLTDYDRFSVDILNKSSFNVSLLADGGGLDTSTLQDQLAHVGTWYVKNRTTRYVPVLQPDGGVFTAPELWDAVSRVLGGFWNGANAVALPSTTPTDTGSPLARDAASAVLRAALSLYRTSQRPPLVGAPLLELLGDGLRPIPERLTPVSFYHDFGCLVRAYAQDPAVRCSSSTVHTQTVDLWRLLASIPDSAALRDAVTAADATDPAQRIQRSWRDVFDSLQLQHRAFEQAAVDAFAVATDLPPDGGIPDQPLYSQTWLLGSDLADAGVADAGPDPSVPVPAAEIAQLVQNAFTRSLKFGRVGLFGLVPDHELNAGVDESIRVAYTDRIDGRIRDIGLARDRYVAAKQQLVQTYLSQVQNRATRDQIAGRLTRTSEQMNQLSQTLASLQQNVVVLDRQLANFAEVLRRAADFEVDQRYAFSRPPLTPETVRDTDARYDVNGSGQVVIGGGSPDDVAVRQLLPAEIGGRGNILTVSTSDQWSAQCAVSQTELFDHAVTIVDALTGPDGYQVYLYSGQAYAYANARDVAQEHRRAWGCLDQLDGGTPSSFGTPEQTFAAVELCGRFTGPDGPFHAPPVTVTRWTNASYVTGFRARNTPFPMYPAGSLLLVAMNRGGHQLSDIHDVFVIRPRTTIVFDQDVDLYWVVNDNRNCTHGAHTLSLQLQWQMPAGTILTNVQRRVASMIRYIQDQTDTYAPQGGLTFSDVSQINDYALGLLIRDCYPPQVPEVCEEPPYCDDCAINNLPASLQSLIRNVLSNKISVLDKRANIVQASRNWNLFQIDTRNLTTDLIQSQAESRYLELLPTWSLQTIDNTPDLEREARQTTDLMLKYLFPIVDVRYPFIFSTLALDPALDNLIKLKWDNEVDGAGTAQATVVLNALTAVKNAMVAGITPATRLRDDGPWPVLSVPRPCPNPGDPDPEDPNPPECTLDPDGVRRRHTSWTNVLDPQNSRAIWHAALAHGWASIPISPLNLYVAAGGSGVLGCNEVSPTISAVGLYLVSDSAFSIGHDTQFQTAINPTFTFVTSNGFKYYTLVNPDWFEDNVVVLGGPSEQHAADDFRTLFPDYAAGRGWSPFATLDINFAATAAWPPLDNPLIRGTEMDLAIKMQRRTETPIHFLPNCP